jgi:hypothetical protein
VANSGDTVEIEMITHHAGDDYEKMIQGDPGIEDIYNVSVVSIRALFVWLKRVVYQTEKIMKS